VSNLQGIFNIVLGWHRVSATPRTVATLARSTLFKDIPMNSAFLLATKAIPTAPLHARKLAAIPAAALVTHINGLLQEAIALPPDASPRKLEIDVSPFAVDTFSMYNVVDEYEHAGYPTKYASDTSILTIYW
jgi:hypothetical protein